MAYLLHTGYALLLINMLLLIKGFSLQGKAFKIYACYTAVMVLIQMATELLRINSINNIWLGHFYFTGQFLLLSLFYRELLPGTAIKKGISYAMAAAPIITSLWYIFDPEAWYGFNLLEISVTSTLLITYSILYFKELLLHKKGFFLINTGLFIYLLGSTIFFLAGNYINTLSSEFNRWTWLAHASLYILFQCLVLAECGGIFINKKTKRLHA